MSAFISRLFKRISRSSTPVVRDQLRSMSWQAQWTSLALEALETRRLLAVNVIEDFGNITDLAFVRFLENVVEDTTVPGVNERFKFSLGQSAVVHASPSGLESFNFLDPFEGELVIVKLDQSGNDVSTVASQTFFESSTSELIVSLPSGNYAADFFRDNVKQFDFTIHADTAPGEFNANSSNPSAIEGRNLGTLLTASGVDLDEFIGLRAPAFDLQFGSLDALTDVIDTHFFRLVKQGTVEFTFHASEVNEGLIDVTLFRDFNNDNVFQRGTAEQIVTRTGIRADQTRVFSPTLPAARYGVVVTLSSINSTVPQKDNYGLRTKYTVLDGAGNTLAAANDDAGTVGNPFGIFNDYLSSSDPFDIYTRTVASGGPFVFEGTLSGMSPGSNFELDFIRDLDGDGQIDDNEVISSSEGDGNANEELSVPFGTGTYFVRVRHTDGEGIYTLQFSNRNTDIAGNTLPSALNFVSILGIKEFTDIVSATDRLDIYKFTFDVESEFDALLTGMPAGTNANLSLIRDSNGNGIIDKGEILAASNNASNANETIAINLAAGDYFVRVFQLAGSPTYKLTLIKDSAGETLANALPLSASGGGEFDFLGSQFDVADVYQFQLGSTRLVGISVGSNSEPLLVRLGQDTNGNGVLDQTEERLNKTIDAGANELLRINLNPGTYFVLVNPLIPDDGTRYHVTIFNERRDVPGNTLAEARDLRILGGVRTFNDFLGQGSIDLMDDVNDFYKFTLGNDGPFQFVSQFSNIDGIVGFQLIRDDNQNQQIDSGEILATVTSPNFNVPPQSIILALFVPGTYYLNVFSNLATYTLSVQAISLDTAGNSLNSVPPPRDLGPLAGSIQNTNNFVGRIDLDDFFRFSVASPGELVASLSGAGASLDIEVIRDVNNNLIIDAGETLASSAAFDGANDQLHGVLLPAADDNYYVRVLTTGGDSGYALSLTFSNQTPFLTPFLISATVPTDIKAVRFDKGGQGVSYGDTTGGNSGNDPAFRSGENIDVDVSTTVDPASGGRRVTNTAPEEFLEYTINVAESALYDFDVRVSSPDLGATFRVLIDNVSVSSSPIAIPDTNGADNMVTIAAGSNVILTAGFHVLRLAIITGTGVNNNFAGSFNFITVRPASTGTFDLTLQHTTVAAYQHVNLALAWTVPVGGWRTLKQVDLRLRDDNGRLIWIRFDEATNTMSLYNQTTGKFETEKEVGSYGVLRSPLANVYMKTTTIAANGANDPTVVITFDIKFKAIARGHWTVEAAASDDLGHNDPFAFAGTVDVV